MQVSASTPPTKKVIGSGRITGHTFLGWGVLEHPPAPLSCAPECGVCHQIHSFIHSLTHSFTHSFILETYIALLQDTTRPTKRRGRCKLLTHERDDVVNLPFSPPLVFRKSQKTII